RMGGVRLRIPARGRPDRHARRRRADHAPTLDERRRDTSWQVLPRRRGDWASASCAGWWHPVLDRRRRRETNSSDRGPIRQLHELLRRPRRRVRAQIADPGRPLPRCGSGFGAITRSVNFNVVIGETAKDVADRLAWIHGQYEPLVPAEQLAAQDKLYAGGPLVGTPEQIIERLQELAALGMSYAIANFRDAAYDRSSIELFAREVIPALT